MDQTQAVLPAAEPRSFVQRKDWWQSNRCSSDFFAFHLTLCVGEDYQSFDERASFGHDIPLASLQILCLVGEGLISCSSYLSIHLSVLRG